MKMADKKVEIPPSAKPGFKSPPASENMVEAQKKK
jgi:hypothetical protein